MSRKDSPSALQRKHNPTAAEQERILSDVKEQLFNALGAYTGNQLISRADFSNFLLGVAGKHDVDAECGYPKQISFEMYKAMYERDGISTRVVSAMSTECWSVPFWVYFTEAIATDEQDELEKQFKAMVIKFNLYNKLRRLDEISGIGHYGVLVCGFGGEGAGSLGQILPCYNENGDLTEWDGQLELLYIMPFDEGEAKILKYNTNQNSARYGKPQIYGINLADPANPNSPAGRETPVHWSRVIHVPSDGGSSSSDIFGPPRMRKVFNYLLNIRKILGGSAEMFWHGGFPITSFEVPPEIVDQVELGKEEREDLAKEIDSVFRGFKRYLALKGVTANQLPPNIADPDTHVDVQLLAISIAIEIPQRVLMGTEEARLASLQDSQSWGKKVTGRHQNHCTPVIVRPLVNLLQAVRYLPRGEGDTVGEYFVKHADIFSVSEIDRAEITGKLVRALGEYVTTGASQIFPPLQFFTIIMDLTVEQAEEVIDAAIEALDDPELQEILDFESEEEKALKEENEILKMKGKMKPAVTAAQESEGELVVNPMMRCTAGGKPGFKWGERGKCYTYTPSNKASINKAKRKARMQGKAVEMSKRMKALIRLKEVIREEKEELSDAK